MTDKEIFIALTDNDRLKESNAIILLEGDGLNRINRCVKLLNDGYASKILISGNITNLEYGSYPPSLLIPELKKSGIKEEEIMLEDKSQHTRQQAEEVLKICEKNNWTRIILVASNFHQYRAYLTFLRVFLDSSLDIEIINAPARDLSWFEDLPWGRRINLLKEEFKKIEKYKELGHIASYKEAIKYQQWKETRI